MVLLSNDDVIVHVRWLGCQLEATGSREVCGKSMSVAKEDKEPAYRLYFYSVCTFRSCFSLSFSLSVLSLCLDPLIDAKPYPCCLCEHSLNCLSVCAVRVAFNKWHLHFLLDATLFYSRELVHYKNRKLKIAATCSNDNHCLGDTFLVIWQVISGTCLKQLCQQRLCAYVTLLAKA